MDGFQRRRERKKKDILNAALSLFMKHGIQKVSIAEIAKEAKVSQVTIYNYFESKHNLIHAVFNYYVDKALAEYEQVVHSDHPFPEKIKQLIFNKTQVARDINEEFYQSLMYEFSSGDYIQKIYAQKVLPHFTDLFNEGKEQGYVDRDLSNEAILFYINMLKDAMLQKDVYQKVLPVTEDITKIFFYGIVGKRDE
ncbi:TetR family transcriptional regulator [Caldalkalibacillus salinus]|uniref:TetR family transcriptional regulator n=1 Tax=Caldalkalibacillus salinus TaxID=2803787 RepID=UPI001920926A